MPITFTDEDFAEPSAPSGISFTDADFDEPAPKAKRPIAKLSLLDRLSGPLYSALSGAEQYVVGPLAHPIRTLEGGIEGAASMISGSPKQLLMRPSEVLERPIAEIPQISAQPTIPRQVLAGIGNAAIDFANFFQTPEGIATLGIGALPKAAQHSLLKTFGAQMATSAPQNLVGAVEEARGGNWQGAAKHIAAAGGETFFASQLGKAAVKPMPKKGVKPDVEYGNQLATEEAITAAEEALSGKAPSAASPGIAASPEILELLPSARATEITPAELPQPVPRMIGASTREAPVPINEIFQEPIERGPALAQVEEMGRSARRAQDFERAKAELEAAGPEPIPTPDPNRPLSAAELWLIENSLRKSILENQLKPIGESNAIYQEANGPIRIVRNAPGESPQQVPFERGGPEAVTRGGAARGEEAVAPKVQTPEGPVPSVEPKPKEPSETQTQKEEVVRQAVEPAPGAAPAEAAPALAIPEGAKPEAIALAKEYAGRLPELEKAAAEAQVKSGEAVRKIKRLKAAQKLDEAAKAIDESQDVSQNWQRHEEAVNILKNQPSLEAIRPSGMAVGIAPPGTEVLHQSFDWIRTLPNKLRGVSAPITSLASEQSGNALVRLASARMAAPLIEKAQGVKVDPKAFEKAARNELYDQLIKDGLAVEHTKGSAAPRIGGKEAELITSPDHRTIWVRKDLAREIERAEDSRGPIEKAGLIEAANILNKIQIAGPTDAVWHVANMIGSIAGSQGGKGVLADLARKLPGVNIADAVTRVTASSIKALKDSPDIQKQLAEITRIGAGREAGHEGLLGKAIGLIDKAGRLVRDDMYQNLVDRGLVTASEAGRREWINQLGQYNPRLMGQFQRFFRDAGFSPFIVAGRNFNRMAMRRLTLDPGIKAANPGAYWQMKAIEAFGVMATLVAVPSLINAVLTGNPNGRPGTKFGQIDTGKDADDGKHIVIDPGQWNGLRRGMRITGIQSLVEGMRKGEPSEKITHKAITDILGGMIHPWAGPAVSAPYIVVTGKSPTQYKESKNPYDYGENLKTALKQLNPVIEGLIEGHEKDKKSVTSPIAEVAKGLGGAAGVKTVFPYTANQEIHNAALNFLKKSGHPELVRKFERSLREPELSDYQPLRDALRANNTDKAKEEIDELLKSRTEKQVAMAMRNYVKLPFTGSANTEKQFIKGLTDEEMALYEKAKEERLAEYQKFLDVWRQ